MSATRTHTRALLTTSTVALLASLGCATPRTEDQAAMDDAIKQARQLRQPFECGHPVALIRRRADATRAFRQIATLSTTCSPGAQSVCERQLLERACALGADAIILEGPARRGAPWNASTQPLSSSNARAIRWTD